MTLAPLPEVIKTARLILRPYGVDDLDDVFAFASDERWSKYLPIPFPYSRQHAVEFLENQIGLDRSVRVAWAIELDGAVIGGINLRLSPEDRLGELGFSIARPLWGQGITTEAACAVVAAAFNGIPTLNRMRAMADERNLASQQVLRKIGMTKEGVLRQNRFTKDELIDEAWFGLLREEWDARVRAARLDV